MRFRVCLVVEFVIALWPATLVAKGLGEAATDRVQATGGLLASLAGLDLGDVTGLVVRALRA